MEMFSLTNPADTNNATRNRHKDAGQPDPATQKSPPKDRERNAREQGTWEQQDSKSKLERSKKTPARLEFQLHPSNERQVEASKSHNHGKCIKGNTTLYNFHNLNTKYIAHKYLTIQLLNTCFKSHIITISRNNKRVKPQPNGVIQKHKIQYIRIHSLIRRRDDITRQSVNQTHTKQRETHNPKLEYPLTDQPPNLIHINIRAIPKLKVHTLQKVCKCACNSTNLRCLANLAERKRNTQDKNKCGRGAAQPQTSMPRHNKQEPSSKRPKLDQKKKHTIRLDSNVMLEERNGGERLRVQFSRSKENRIRKDKLL